MNDPTQFSTAPNLNDPAQLAAACDSWATSARSMIEAAQGGRPATHPDPVFFYGSIAAVLRAAALQIGKDHPPAKTEKVEKPETKAPETPKKEK